MFPPQDMVHKPKTSASVWQCLSLLVMWPSKDDRTSVSLVYSEDSPVQQRYPSLLSLLQCYWTDPVLSGMRGLIWELKPEQHSLHLRRHSYSTCRDTMTQCLSEWHMNMDLQEFCRSSVCFSITCCALGVIFAESLDFLPKVQQHWLFGCRSCWGLQ